MPNILFTADIHIGLKSYSQQLNTGMYSEEENIRIALNNIYERCTEDDIEMIIIGGDFFTSSHPSSYNIEFAIEWIYRMDKLSKPFYILVGNHDVSTYSNSTKFLLELKSSHTFLIENYIDTFTADWYKHKIKFVPFTVSSSNKNKDEQLDNNFTHCIINAIDGDIICSHLQENSCVVGSEARQISKSVDIIDMNNYKNKNLLLLLGHIHTYQSYKKGRVNIHYSGSLTAQDIDDIGIKKGYLLIDENLNVTFEEIKGIRKFNKYVIPEEVDPMEFFKNIRLQKNSVVFIEHNYSKINTNEIYKFFREKNCIVGSIKKISQQIKTSSTVVDKIETSDPMQIMTAHIELKCKENNITDVMKNNILAAGRRDIDSYSNIINKEI